MKNQRPFRIGALMVSVLSAMLAVGCQQERPLHVVRDSAEFHFKQQRFEEAAAEYAEYCRRRPNDPEMQYMYGRTLMELGRASEARVPLNVAHDIRPGNDLYADGLARALYESNDTSALMTFLTRRTTERGRVADYLRLGRYAVMVGLPDEGLAALHTAARLDRGRSIEPYVALADLYATIGDRRKEILRLRHALYIEPDNQVIQRRLASLGEIVGPSLPLRPPELDDPITPIEPAGS
jgi:cytochrome c-type biogenesis protein CcmH/NrfG